MALNLSFYPHLSMPEEGNESTEDTFELGDDDTPAPEIAPELSILCSAFSSITAKPFKWLYYVGSSIAGVGREIKHSDGHTMDDEIGEHLIEDVAYHYFSQGALFTAFLTLIFCSCRFRYSSSGQSLRVRRLYLCSMEHDKPRRAVPKTVFHPFLH